MAKLTIQDRKILINQHLILAALYPDDRQTHLDRVEVYRWGYELFYEDSFVTEQAINVGTCCEIINILSMFEDMLKTNMDLQQDSKLAQQDVEMKGMPEPYLSFAKFYLERRTNGYYKNVKPESLYLNTDGKIMSKYRNMLDRYNETGNEYQLSCKDIEYVVLG